MIKRFLPLRFLGLAQIRRQAGISSLSEGGEDLEVVYLGLFQKVFNWVLSRILDPVYRFVSSLLTTVLSWVFEKILAPILMPILEDALEFFIDLWLKVMSTRLYLLLSGILKLIDYLETAFDVFIGLRPVTYTDPNGRVITGTLVEVLIQQENISTVFWLITFGALGLALLLTIYGTARSAFDLDFENKRPVSKVLTAMMKTFIQFFMVPFLVYFMLQLSSIILTQVTDIMNFGNTTSLGRIVFMISSLNAAKDDQFNVGAENALDIEFGTSPEDTVRYPFYSMASQSGTGVKDYGNIGQVSDVFDLSKFDFLVGFIAAVFLLFTIGVCLIIFVQRIFELILLYLVSPYFVCMMPLDDGEKFHRWREMFIGKCFTGFGSVIGMRLYLLICPMVMGGRIQFGTATSPEMDYMMKLFFLAGGAWAMYKSGSMITSLLSYQAGMSESNTAAMAGGMLYSHTVGMAMAKGGQALRMGMSRLGSGKGGAGKGEGSASGKEGGRFGGKRAGDSVMRDSKKQGLGTRLKNTAGLASITKKNLSSTAESLRGGNFKEAAKSGLKTIDGISNLKRVYHGQEAKAGIGERLRNRYNNTVEAASRGSDFLSASIEKTKSSVVKGAGSLQNAYDTLRRPGSTGKEMFSSLAAAGRDIYGARKAFNKTRQDIGNISRDLRGAIHKVDVNGSTLSMDFSGKVLAREFDGLGIFSMPPQKPPAPGSGPGGVQVNIDRGLSRLESAIGSLDSSSGSGGASGSGSGSGIGRGSVSSAGSGIGRGSVSGAGSGIGRGSTSGAGSGLGTDSGRSSILSSGSSSASGSGRAGSGGQDLGAGSRRAGTVPWTSGTVSRSQVRCTSIPAVQKVSGSSPGGKVTYQSLSVKGLKASAMQGKGTITRRNSL